AGAADLDDLLVTAPAGNRARSDGGIAGAGRPDARLLRPWRLRGGRVGLEARTPVSRRAQRAPLEGGLPQRGLSRDDDGGAVAERDPGLADSVRAARTRGRPRQEREPLPPAG